MTVPDPEGEAHEALPEPSVSRNSPEDPAAVGSFKVHDPAASATDRMTVPLVLSWTKLRESQSLVLAIPIVGVAVNAGPRPSQDSCHRRHQLSTMLPVAVVIARGDDAVTAGVPDDVPKVIVGVLAAACGVSVTAPDELPSRTS